MREPIKAHRRVSVEDFLRYADAGKGPSTQMMEAAAEEIRLLRRTSERWKRLAEKYRKLAGFGGSE